MVGFYGDFVTYSQYVYASEVVSNSLPMLKYFLSTGSEDFRGGAAEYLIANPELSEKQLNSVGEITPISNMQPSSQCMWLFDSRY